MIGENEKHVVTHYFLFLVFNKNVTSVIYQSGSIYLNEYIITQKFVKKDSFYKHKELTIPFIIFFFSLIYLFATKQMNYSGFNYKTHTVQRDRSNFLTTTHKLRFPPRYLRQPIDHRARTYGVPVSQRRRANFFPTDRQFRRYPSYPQQRMNYWGFNNPTPISSPEPPNNWRTGWKIISRIRQLITFILKIVHYIQSRGNAKLASYGWSCGCCCGAASATTVVVAIALGVSLGVGLGVGLQHNGQYMNSTIAFNLSNATNVTIGR